ncbi:hypothetical protein MPTK1_2g07000 [Marchantia polymorpha subsp. ruderalis]|uniref:Protein kinase domain-containing protein n=1 Tax=Marchantia polymorpha TaxID=3197 RepID=A0A2R6XE13_MARPO|nr:hypothetical protein MARPO_0021s0153 [Marchantia polymorpha]BBN01383.1 hypothetical protein Mp_2g07000 [Marchantia polymorpha subsp. ruderalis]|eukprot:PTQ44309.1 hypothetical protein MARPO_0021s0153 [Marchantia polymorpha]
MLARWKMFLFYERWMEELCSSWIRGAGWTSASYRGRLDREVVQRGQCSSQSLAVRAVSTTTKTSSGPATDQSERLAKLNELLVEVAKTAANTGPRGAVRLAQGLEAVATVGAEWLLQQTQGAQIAVNARSPFALDPPGPKQLRKLFEKLGATYIKLGQFIASAPTLFPAEYVKEFQSCLDKTPPISFNQIKAIIRQDLGRSLEDVYEYIDPEPLASASIAQVHAARLKESQKDVVIKVLKPDVEDTLTVDLNFIYITAKVLEFLNPQLSRTSLVAIVGDIRASMLEEVDFRKEAMNIEAFRNYLEATGSTRLATAPYVYRHCSSRRVLTMERFFGAPLSDLDSIRSIVPNPEATLINALNVWFGSLIACETFHADVHAGNLLVLKDGRIGFIDFGIVGRISPATWVAMETFLNSIGSNQYPAMAKALVTMGATAEIIDIDSFAKDLEKIFTAVGDLDSDVLITAAGSPGGPATVAASMAFDEQQVNALLLEVIRVSESYGLRFPREFGLLLKQLLYFDRYTRLLAPGLNVFEDDRVQIASSRDTTYFT